MKSFTLNIRGMIYEYTRPIVMGILNITEDSFFGKSCAMDDIKITGKVKDIINKGADIIDIGAYSTRPGYNDISEAEEMERITRTLFIINKFWEGFPVSVDTFRANVAEQAVKIGAGIVNDVSGGSDPKMFETISSLKVPYVLTHSNGNIDNLHEPFKTEDIVSDVLCTLAEKCAKLEQLGVNDIIIDLGFGFSKTLDQNYQLLANLKVFNVLHKPILVGVSRKSMISKVIDTNASEALNGTIAANTLALNSGASILRVHDVRAAKDTIAIYQQYNKCKGYA